MTYEEALQIVIDAAYARAYEERHLLGSKESDDLMEAINIVSERAKVDAGDFSI